MPANNALKVTSLDFDTIRSNLKTFLSSQNEFSDYDFEGSTISTLLDLMSYNTYYQSVYTNMVANEMFLDSAILRNNVVSNAKMLGYTPSSAQGSTATIQVNVTPTGSPDSLTVAKNTAFTSTIDGVDYTFVTPEQSVILNASGTYSANLVIREGTPLTHRFTVNSNNPVRYVIPNADVDTGSLAVTVQVSSSNTTSNTYTRATNITNVDENSPVYYLQENLDGKFELTFGDGVLGNRLQDGNIVIANYRVTNGSTTNGANNFVSPATIGGESNFTVNLISAASGGADRESIDSIKYNAPKNFQAQNRAVTTNDYKNIVLAENPDVQNLSVWGGEQNEPPVYGRVYMAAKPVTGNTLSSARKAAIVESLKSRQVQSIEAEMVDPTYLYIKPTIDVHFDSERTTLSSGELLTKVKNKIIGFETASLNDFKVEFLYSRFIRAIDDADDAITNNSTTIEMQQRVNHTIGSGISYTLNFNNAIFNPHAGHVHAISSNAFTFNGLTQYFDDDGNGNIRRYYFSSSQTRVVTDANAGTVNYLTGQIKLTNFNPTAIDGDILKINAKPASNEVIPVRAQIILIADTKITMIEDRGHLQGGNVVRDIFSGSLTVGDETLASTALSTVYY